MIIQFLQDQGYVTLDIIDSRRRRTNLKIARNEASGINHIGVLVPTKQDPAKLMHNRKEVAYYKEPTEEQMIECINIFLKHFKKELRKEKLKDALHTDLTPKKVPFK